MLPCWPAPCSAVLSAVIFTFDRPLCCQLILLICALQSTLPSQSPPKQNQGATAAARQPACRLDAAMAFAVGAQVQLELSLPSGAETAVGQVFAYDAATDRVVLSQPGSTPFHATLRVLKGTDVKSVVQIRPAPPGGGGPLPAVDLSRCREREEKAVRAAEVEAAKIGVGVGRTAQVMRCVLLGCRCRTQCQGRCGGGQHGPGRARGCVCAPRNLRMIVSCTGTASAQDC